MRNNIKYALKLGEYNNWDTERYWYFRKRLVDNKGKLSYQGYYCYNCKKPLLFSVNRYQTEIQPLYNHGPEIKRVKMEQEKNWIPHSKEVIYYRAFCCACFKNCDRFTKLQTLLNNNL